MAWSLEKAGGLLGTIATAGETARGTNGGRSVWREAVPVMYHHLVEQDLLARALMLVKISCARCQGALMLNEEHVGRLVRCPTCKSTFTAQPPESAEVEGIEPEIELI